LLKILNASSKICFAIYGALNYVEFGTSHVPRRVHGTPRTLHGAWRRE
jgi:hypothetical protein